MIETHALTKVFDDFTAVEDVNLLVGRGQVLALLGPNGAGKTTTVRMLTSILKPTRGWARVAGFDVVADAPRVRALVGVLTEQAGLYGRMPAQEYMEFFGEIYGLSVTARRQRSQRLLTHFGLADARHRKIGEFSKGMKQKLALARALIHEPPVLLLDEPTSAMDPESARLVRDAIHELRSSERAVIICTHNLAEAEELADQIAIIRRGRIIVRGTPAALKLSLLGPPEYEMRLAGSFDPTRLSLPAGVSLTSHGENWLRYRTADPERSNPLVLHDLLNQGTAIYSLHEVPRSLEQVYLRAIMAPEGLEGIDVR
jgi:ABC-2 type transport system ATP-binding protein